MQIGDPFTGKKLIESSLELVERGLVESLQDCGAAGLASSLAEMAGGDGGIDVLLDSVPLREEEMEPWEIMISESQERMVAVVRPENLAAVEEVCARWELDHAPIGEVTDTGELRAYFDGELVGAIPAAYLTDEAPRYEVARAAEAGRRAGARSRRARPPTARCSSCSRRRTSAVAPGSTAGTTISSARAPSAGPGSTRPSSGFGPRSAASPSASTARAGSPGSTPTPAARSPCSRRRATSRAPAASRSRSPTA